MGERLTSQRGPSSLHVKIALSMSLIVLAVSLLLFSVYWSAARGLVEEENKRSAELTAAQLGQHLSSEQIVGNLAALRNDALYYKRVHGNVREIRIYGFTPTGVRQVVTVPVGTPKDLPLDLVQTVTQGKLYSRIEEAQQEGYLIEAAAPIESAGKPIGIVVVQAHTASYGYLLARLKRITVMTMGLAMLAISGSLYLLFRRFVYTPIGEVLAVMRRAEQGELNLEVPVRSTDEMGLLGAGLNTMLARIHQMRQALMDEQKRLEVRVADATAELSQRNRELQQANRELFALQRQLIQTERLAAAGQLAAQFAHEVGTPLNLISGHIQLLQSRLRDEDAVRRFAIILGQIERIEGIVRRFLDSTRPPRLEMVPLRIDRLLEQVIEMVTPLLESRGIEMITDIASSLPEIKGSAEQLQQVLINLIDNSLDAMPEGGHLVIRARVEDQQLLIECQDSGLGMSPEVLSRVFDPFFTTKPDGVGSGLGLAIVRRIVHQHGGTITAESHPGEGSRFVITLPVLTPSPLPEPAPMSSDSPDPSPEEDHEKDPRHR